MVQSAARSRGRPPAAERAPERSRAELTQAAAELVAEQGFEAASVQQICARAGLSKGTFYWNFDSKGELFLALVEERVERPIREAIALLGSATAGQDMAQESNRALLDALRRDRNAVLLDDEYWLRAVRDPVIRRRYARRQRDLRAALADALESRRRQLGAPPFRIAPEHLAIGYLSLVSGIARSRLVDPDGIPDELFAEFLGITFAGLVATAEAGN